MKIIKIENTEYELDMNLGVAMEYEQLTGHAFITSKKLTTKDIYSLIYCVLKANNEHFTETFKYFVKKTLTNNTWIIDEISKMLFPSETKVDEEKKK